MFAMLISAPLMTQGLWHRIVAIIATNPREADFEKLDAFNDKLWPHGPNMLEGTFARGSKRIDARSSHRFERIEFEEAVSDELPVLGAHARATLPASAYACR